nr:hypothetical protein [uncultured Butyrivibrio sp.]
MKKQKIFTILTSCIASFQMLCVYASAAEDLLSLIIDIVAKGLIAGAVILAIMGISKWASAHAEGDGPEMKKATNMLTATIIMVVISAIMIASEETIASILTT